MIRIGKVSEYRMECAVTGSFDEIGSEMGLLGEILTGPDMKNVRDALTMIFLHSVKFTAEDYEEYKKMLDGYEEFKKSDKDLQEFVRELREQDEGK